MAKGKNMADKEIRAFRVEVGQTIEVDGLQYKILKEPRGEFATYVEVEYLTGKYVGRVGEIYLPSGSTVTVKGE